MHPAISTLGELKASGYRPRSIKDELRANLVRRLKAGQTGFAGVLGFDDTVIPELQTALLARHNILLLGLRGQAKTRIARTLVELLDEWVPVVQGSELNDDPLQPLSRYAHDLIAEHGDLTPIGWLHRNERYAEKLATPDVTVADLIGDLDPIKAATLKLSYADERVIHYGIIPRSHRSLFVINELPDLQARIQVALFNILQEGDIQIRGFKLRLPLDIQFVFTANPEDYTNRGSIVTPLKDRIESQILTHYPKSLDIARAITQQEAHLAPEQRSAIRAHKLVEDLVEQIAFEARSNEYVDPKSGVSARLTIAALENVYSYAERRLILSKDKATHLRISDLYAAIPAITGKVELVYEGEQEGALKVAHALISKALRTQFERVFPNPEKAKRTKATKGQTEPAPNPYKDIIDWFGRGNKVDLLRDLPNRDYTHALSAVPGLQRIVREYTQAQGINLDAEGELLYMEFMLHGLAEFSQLSKAVLVPGGFSFKDMLGGLLSGFGAAGGPDLSDLDFDDDDDPDDKPRRRR